MKNEISPDVKLLIVLNGSYLDRPAPPNCIIQAQLVSPRSDPVFLPPILTHGPYITTIVTPSNNTRSEQAMILGITCHAIPLHVRIDAFWIIKQQVLAHSGLVVNTITLRMNTNHHIIAQTELFLHEGVE